MAPDQRMDDSVYDFMYVDARRIAQFSSQFNQYGHLTGLTRTVSETRTGGGGVNVGAAKFDKSAQAQEGQTKQFDPQWLNPLTFLDDAGKRGMIVRDLAVAGIDQLVLISGRLSIFDISIVKSIWGIDQLVEKAMAGTLGQEENESLNRNQRRAKRSAPQPNVTDQAKMAKALLPNLPHLVQGSIYNVDRSFWFSLRNEFLITSPSDLMLKHGVSVPGNWNAVGILDARPSIAGSPESTEQTLDHLIAASKYGALGEFIRDISTAVRTMLGRPDTSYGLTPLLIFREIGN